MAPKALSAAIALMLFQGREVLGAGNATSAVAADMKPIRKVITLIEEMKVQCDKDAEEDLKAYDKFMCWCKTNEKEKGEAIEAGKAHIDELNAFLEEAAAKEGELKTLIATLTQEIADDQDALATATATREKEFEAFQAAEADMKETKALLREAIQVLEKVQLVQKQKAPVDLSRAREVLLQVRDRVQKHPKFQGVMQKDLFDVFGSLESFVKRNDVFLPRRAAASFEQEANRLLPWEKSEEQMGKEAKPNDLKGAAAGAKSYNSRSGGILGLLAQMEDQFSEDLSEAQKADFIAEVNFQNLRAAKLGEIEAATQQKEDAETELADLLNKVAQSKRDLERTQEAIAADEEFLANMRKDCEHEDEEYKKRAEVRSQEQVALAETIKILTEDDARDLYDKTMSFLQVDAASTAAARERAVSRVVSRIAKIAKAHKNWALVGLAVRVRLDAFTKVKEAMDKMHAELAKQQKEEYAKWELCKKEIDRTEDDIKVGEHLKEDLDEQHLQLVNQIDQLNSEIEALKKEEQELMVALKQAGEQRKEANELFQTSVMDQRAVINILNKALARLKQFYQPSAELVEVSAHEPNQPGFAVAPRPKGGKAYAKSAGSGGVIQLIMKVIEDAELEEQQLAQDEQSAQADYSEFVQVTTTNIEKDRALVAEKTELVAQTEAAKSETEEKQLSNDESLAKLNDLLKAHHVECDYVLKYFDIRQKARQEEMDAITDAKAVLSGANFGK
eukprot:CAMPEP_0176106300 /NCGR_PEP_ID=MMETSP0120_2-20121206/53345_1 /TAXON_ID=160619 /ORGANISM="Kryptoperidinium foliaceum, Strain CCMP 1326" /LENGTH=732 /DNA_ID=CAMNT_0017440423 /DNA_START=78 /DNA_END=2276 /DNA_ORIENTATION=-